MIHTNTDPDDKFISPKYVPKDFRQVSGIGQTHSSTKAQSPKIVLETLWEFEQGERFNSFADFSVKLRNFLEVTGDLNVTCNSLSIEQHIRSSIKAKKMINLIKRFKFWTIKLECECGHQSKKTSCNVLKDTYTKKLGCCFQLHLKCNYRYIFVEKYILHITHTNVSFRKFKMNDPSSTALVEKLQQGIDLKASVRNILGTETKIKNKKINYNDAYSKSKQFIQEKEQKNMNKFYIHELLGNFKRVYDDNGKEIGIYYQDNYMKNLYSKYADVLFLDGTYKLTNVDHTVFILSVINGEMKTEPVLIFSSVDEQFQTIAKFFEFFKKDNDMLKPYLVLTDKDLTERKILS